MQSTKRYSNKVKSYNRIFQLLTLFCMFSGLLIFIPRHAEAPYVCVSFNISMFSILPARRSAKNAKCVRSWTHTIVSALSIWRFRMTEVFCEKIRLFFFVPPILLKRSEFPYGWKPGERARSRRQRSVVCGSSEREGNSRGGWSRVSLFTDHCEYARLA